MIVQASAARVGIAPRIVDFCDMPQFERMMRDWASATGLATVAMGDDGEYISECYNFTEFCHGLTRRSPEGLRRCIACDKHGVGIYRCHAGLVDFAAPITLGDGTVLGNILGGQVLPAQPDESRFRSTARALDIDEDAYIAALRKVNVRSDEEIESSYHLLANVINQFVRASYAARTNATALAERSRIISSLSQIYFCDYFIELERDRYVELDATERLHAFTGDSGVASEMVPAAILRFASESHRDGFLEFADLSTLAERMRGRHSVSYEFPATGIGWCRALFIPVDEDVEGRAIHVIYAIQDIHEEKERDLEVRRALEVSADEAQRANEAKSEFLSRMSHDMRTPLNGIIGMTYLTQEMSLPDGARENLEKIDRSSKFLLGLINDVLDMTRAESGRIELHPEPYPFPEFIRYFDAVIRPLCAEKGQDLEVAFHPPQLSEVPLVDKLRTSQIIFNVLSNAVKYTPEGGRISYDIGEELLPDGRLAFDHVISDNGIGMSEEFQRHLFEPFSQENRNDVSERRGSGLGLAIVKRLADAMGATIEVESKLGAGTTFRLHFVFDAVSAAEARAREGGSTTADAGDVDLTGRRVLICEDHPLNQEIARSLLEERGAIADIAEDGAVGLEKIEKSAVGFYDAVLMDVRMPVMDGLETTRAIRRLDRADAKTLPIIAMTADAFEDDVRRCLDAGMDAHVPKPIDPRRLYGELAEALEARC